MFFMVDDRCPDMPNGMPEVFCASQCKPLSLAKDSGFSSKTLDIMLTHSVPYLPKKDQDSLVFYGTQKFYVFLRFFYTLYERILKAWELCHQFEENNKTRGLS